MVVVCVIYVEWYDVSDWSLYCVAYLFIVCLSFLTSSGLRDWVVSNVDNHGVGLFLEL